MTRTIVPPASADLPAELVPSRVQPPGATRVKSAKRSADMKAKWDDPTVGADGLTYRQRRVAASKAARAAQLAPKSKSAPIAPAPSAAAPASPAPPPPDDARPKGGRGLRRWR